MLDYDTNNRLHEARSHANGLAADMRRSRSPRQDGAGDPGACARLGFALADRLGLLRRRRHTPSYQG